MAQLPRVGQPAPRLCRYRRTGRRRPPRARQVCDRLPLRAIPAPARRCLQGPAAPTAGSSASVASVPDQRAPLRAASRAGDGAVSDCAFASTCSRSTAPRRVATTRSAGSSWPRARIHPPGLPAPRATATPRATRWSARVAERDAIAPRSTSRSGVLRAPRSARRPRSNAAAIGEQVVQPQRRERGVHLDRLRDASARLDPAVAEAQRDVAAIGIAVDVQRAAPGKRARAGAAETRRLDRRRAGAVVADRAGGQHHAPTALGQSGASKPGSKPARVAFEVQLSPVSR